MHKLTIESDWWPISNNINRHDRNSVASNSMWQSSYINVSIICADSLIIILLIKHNVLEDSTICPPITNRKCHTYLFLTYFIVISPYCNTIS